MGERKRVKEREKHMATIQGEREGVLDITYRRREREREREREGQRGREGEGGRGTEGGRGRGEGRAGGMERRGPWGRDGEDCGCQRIACVESAHPGHCCIPRLPVHCMP